ncbi:helix-turn-helix domain-containing protein [[Flexibacter] sp. ATCC 35208]|uniref:AraC family transcriptional regulator n=1 Tax=[Flexibacter] sp. ATCC 35208 TaxID=1936242 RepID=UPI0009CE40E8|nr:helix-turn-helix domain-containing protein [[Flexibacter] sp. ATCC 35208]OMP79112.1 hypothetical protein BW716_10850 [[Flexibacter] sp. ATCC 35208]
MKAIPVKSKIYSHQLLKISPFKEVIKPTVPHKHADYFELIVLEHGAGYHIIDDQSYDVLPPSIYFLKPGQVHCWDFTRIPKGYVILFREELLNRKSLEIVYNLPVLMQLKENAMLLELVKCFCQDYQSSASPAILEAYLQLILLKAAEESNAQLQDGKPFNPIYYQFKSLVNVHFQQIKKIQAYAEMLHLPGAQLNTICKTASGKTPSMILNERIVLEAKILLSNTELSIKEIAASLEFSDPSHFVKFFKLYTNLTPGIYRELAFAKRH